MYPQCRGTTLLVAAPRLHQLGTIQEARNAVGRHAKSVGATLGVDRRDSGYYATPPFVSEFIAKALLGMNPHGRSALDPCIGRGEMVLPFLEQGIGIDGFDLLPFAMPDGVRFTNRDFLEFYADQRIDAGARQINLPFDYYLANPPYNCHEVDYIRASKAKLLRLFKNIGAHNMYSMFMSAIIALCEARALMGTHYAGFVSHVAEPSRLAQEDPAGMLAAPSDSLSNYLFRTQAPMSDMHHHPGEGRGPKPGPVRVLDRPHPTANSGSSSKQKICVG